MSTTKTQEPKDTTTNGKPTTNGKGQELAAASARFMEKVARQFKAELGESIQFTELQRRLAQHMYLKCDAAFKALAAKGTPVGWNNVNLEKLALDTIHRISLELDALIPNHIHVIPYKNGKTNLYDIDLRIGYEGAIFARRKFALVPPTDIVIQLVHETDEFTPHMRGRGNEIESYDFIVKNPFNRGAVVGGFGYVSYEDPRLNRLYIITDRDFKRAEAGAQTKDFWDEKKHRQEMQFKTVVHRTVSKIALDSNKVNAGALATLEGADLDIIDVEVEAVAALEANATNLNMPMPEPVPEGETVPVQEAF